MSESVGYNTNIRPRELCLARVYWECTMKLYQILPTGSILTEIFPVNGNSRIMKQDKSLRGMTTNFQLR